MDDTVDLFKRSLAIYQRDPVAWSLLYGVVMFAGVATAGLGFILMPNAFRATRDAINEERAPDLQAVFQFGDAMMEDAIAMGGLIITTMVAGSFTGPIAGFLSILLGLAPTAVTEPTVGGLDALQLSVGFAQEKPVPMFLHGIAGMLLNVPGACCLFPLLVTVPITAISQWLFYVEHRDVILKVPKQLVD